MNRTLRTRGAAATLALLVLPLALGASCSKKLTVDPSYTTPEGQSSTASRLIVWPELPTTFSVYDDNLPVGPDPDDVFIGYETRQRVASGTVHGLLLDRTSASTYQFLRSEASGGLLPLQDFTIPPSRRWLDEQWEAFRFDDPRPGTGSAYVGRGLVAGEVTEFSPVSNKARFSGGAIADLPLEFLDANNDTVVTWQPVPDAQYYVVQMYRFREATGEEQILSGQAAPLYLGNSRDYFVAVTDTPGQIGFSPFYNVIQLSGFDPVVLSQRDSLPDAGYFVRVAAVSAAGEMIAFSYGDSGTAARTTTYARYPLGAKVLPRPRILTGSPERFGGAAAVRFDDPARATASRRR